MARLARSMLSATSNINATMDHTPPLVRHLCDRRPGALSHGPLRRFATGLRHAVTALLAAALGLAQAQDCPDSAMDLHEPLPGVQVRHGQWPAMTPEGHDHHASTVVLWSGRRASVFDPGPTAHEGLALQRALACRGVHQIERVFNSHAHAEQVLANVAYRAPVAATARTQASMRQRCPDCLAALRHDLGQAATRGTRIVLPKQVLHEGQFLQAGGRHWQVLDLRAAHTESDLALWSKGDGVLIAGGLIDGQRLVLAQGSVVGWLAALDRLQALQPQWLIGQHRIAHGPAQVQAAFAAQREALCQLTRLSWQGLEQGWSETEALNRMAVQGTPDAQRQQRFNLLRAWREMEALWLVQAPFPLACEAVSAPDVGR